MAQSKLVWFGMKLTPGQKQQIKLLAQREGTSAKEAVMSLVEQALRAETPTPDPGSFLEAIRDLAGSIGSSDGPVDLATNPAHMEGFGR